MSDAHGHDVGAHEIDKMPAGRLFNILGGLSVLTLALCLGVIQMFNQQVKNIEGQRAKAGSFTQLAYQEEMTGVADGFGRYAFDKEGKEVTRFFVPVANAQKQVIDDPKLLAGARPGRTWAKSGTATKIKEWGGLPKPKPPAKAEAPTKVPAQAAVQAPQPHDFSFAVREGKLMLSGKVPSAEVSKSIEDAAKKTHFGEQVANKLKVTGTPANKDFAGAYARALAVLDLMSSGSARWTGGKLAVDGFVSDANKEKADTLLKAAGGPPMGTSALASTEVADACDKDFAKALKRTKIQFVAEKADIEPKSKRALGKLAAIAKRCPGTVVIEGHTDEVDDDKANKALSQFRANSVLAALVEEGIEKTRLKSFGFGRSRPVATGDKDSEPAKNGRIEVRIAR